MKRTSQLKRSGFKRRSKSLAKRSKQPRSKRKTLEPIKALKMRVWTLISQYVRKRDGYKCVSCGATGVNMDCGHYRHNTERNMSLGGNALWYDLRNLNCQCSFYCNRNMSGNPVPYGLFLESKYGFGILQEIDRLYRTYRKWTREELLEKIVWLEQEIEKL